MLHFAEQGFRMQDFFRWPMLFVFGDSYRAFFWIAIIPCLLIMLLPLLHISAVWFVMMRGVCASAERLCVVAQVQEAGADGAHHAVHDLLDRSPCGAYLLRGYLHANCLAAGEHGRLPVQGRHRLDRTSVGTRCCLDVVCA